TSSMTGTFIVLAGWIGSSARIKTVSPVSRSRKATSTITLSPNGAIRASIRVLSESDSFVPAASEEKARRMKIGLAIGERSRGVGEVGRAIVVDRHPRLNPSVGVDPSRSPRNHDRPGPLDVNRSDDSCVPDLVLMIASAEKVEDRLSPIDQRHLASLRVLQAKRRVDAQGVVQGRG